MKLDTVHILKLQDKEIRRLSEENRQFRIFFEAMGSRTDEQRHKEAQARIEELYKLLLEAEDKIRTTIEYILPPEHRRTSDLDLVNRITEALGSRTDEQRNEAKLTEIAEIAHAGGLKNMSENRALTEIRKLSLEFWRKE